MEKNKHLILCRTLDFLIIFISTSFVVAIWCAGIAFILKGEILFSALHFIAGFFLSIEYWSVCKCFKRIWKNKKLERGKHGDNKELVGQRPL